MSTTTAEIALATEARPARSTWHHLWRHPAATAGAIYLTILVLATVFAPLVSPYSPIQIHLAAKLQAPSLSHLLGTDYFGRDILSRVIYGGRVSLTVGALTMLFTLVTGIPAGMIAGLYGGSIDNILMRLADALLTFPPLLLAAAIVGLLGSDVFHVMLAMGLVQAPTLARLTRASVMASKQELHVLAARALGASTLRIVFSNILRNILGPLIVQLATVFAVAIVTEAALSFLGLGTQPPQPSWGRDLSEAREYIGVAPWMFIAPSAVIVLCALSIKASGDLLQNYFDPRSKRR